MGQNKKRLLSLFSGCGGMDLGFEGGFKVPLVSIGKGQKDWISKNHGNGWATLKETSFQTVFANDIERAAKAAWEPYFKEKRGNSEAVFIHGSIVDLVKAHKSGEFSFPSDIDIVTGGFPCQDFSVAGKRKGFASHKSHKGALIEPEMDCPTEENRGVLYKWMREVIAITLPKMFIAENVKGLVSLPDAQAIISQDFSDVGGGYHVVSPRVLHAARYGVPQTRERVIFIGFRKDTLKPGVLEKLQELDTFPEMDPYPSPTHFLPGDFTSSKKNTALRPFVSVGSVLRDLPEPDLSDDLSHQGYSKAKFMGAHCQGQKEINLNLPGPTIRSEHHGNIEFRRLSVEHNGNNTTELQNGLAERRLSVRECARIQTFPDDMEFVRKLDPKDWRKLSITEGYKLVGNAVPPLLAFNLAKRIETLWDTIFEESVNDNQRELSKERIRALA
ncbi:DNA cytosine methyltransferase [Vampirovibrio chlorellavorus]|uniref:DNA cytosine methyltransferase n=1 Tax=Vampirovibrio chlorellavorus TaxID=758823 RepID=UPI0026EA1AFD|nr:DNA (cytosine-5-)-methyltransferase [Vampirovibrio chlorellavorus]